MIMIATMTIKRKSSPTVKVEGFEETEAVDEGDGDGNGDGSRVMAIEPNAYTLLSSDPT
jgi:hypothetical protein